MNLHFRARQPIFLISRFRRVWPARIVSVASFGLILACADCGVYAQSDAPQGRMITSLAVAINLSTHKVYAVDEAAGAVSVTDERTGTTQMVKVGNGPISIAINSITDRIYVANTGSGSISVIDGERDAVIATVKGESHPYVLAVNEATNKVYVTNTYGNAVTVIDGATNAAQALKVGDADGIAVDPRNNTIFLMSYEDPNLRVVNGATGAITKVAVGAHLWGIALDQSSNTLYLAHMVTGDVVAVDEKAHQVKTIPIGSISCAVAINPVTQMVYAVNYGDETVSVIDVEGRSHTACR